MKRETKRTPRKLARIGMADYVSRPAQQSAGYFALTGLGLGVGIVAYNIYPMHREFGLSLVIVAMPLVFAGVGGMWMLRPRLNDFFYDIITNVQEEVTEIFEDETQPVAPRIIRNANGDAMAELSTESNLSRGDWQKVAAVVRGQNKPISQQVLSRDRATKCLSRSQYQWMWNFMQTQGYLVAENGRNTLTREGQLYLDNYLGYPPTPGGRGAKR